MRRLLVPFLMLAAMPSVVTAADVINGDFETGTDPGSFSQVEAGDTDVANWTVDSGSIDYIGTYWQPASGNRSIDLAGLQAGSIFQDIATNVGTRYLVTFSLARNPDGGTTPRFGTVGVDGLATKVLSFGNAGTTRADMGWETRGYAFTATSALSRLRFSADPFSSTSTPPNGFGAAFGPALDNVSIAGVPEPATWAMMILGFGLIGGAMRRRPATKGTLAAA